MMEQRTPIPGRGIDRVFDPLVTKPGLPPLDGSSTGDVARPSAEKREGAEGAPSLADARRAAVGWALAAALVGTVAAVVLLR
jgi:hypothetical protein